MLKTKRTALFSFIMLSVLLFQMMIPMSAYAEGELTPTPQTTETAPAPTREPLGTPLPTEKPTQPPAPTPAPTETKVTETVTVTATAELIETITPAASQTTLPQATRPTVGVAETPAPAIAPEDQLGNKPRENETPQAPDEQLTYTTQVATGMPILPTDLAKTETSASPVVSDPLGTIAGAVVFSASDLPALLEKAPVDTGVVVVGRDGQPLALASVKSAVAIATNQAVWCPAGQPPTPGLNGCTANYPTMNQLLAAIQAGIETVTPNPSGGGTIWVASGADADTTTVTIDGVDYPDLASFMLTIQGGWSGISGDSSIITTNSQLTAGLEIIHWQNDVTINNITVSGGNGSIINTTGNIRIHNSGFNNYAGTENAGLWIQGTGNNLVEIMNSTFNGNRTFGAQIENVQNVVVSNSNFDGNSRAGLWIWKQQGTTNTTISNSTFNNNLWDGLAIDAHGSATISGSTFSNNLWDGTWLNQVDTVNISNSIFNNNSWSGLRFYHSNGGSISITNSSFTLNDIGLFLSSAGLSGSVLDSSFLQNSTAIQSENTSGSLIIECQTLVGNGADFSARNGNPQNGYLPSPWRPTYNPCNHATPTPGPDPNTPTPAPTLVAPITTIVTVATTGEKATSTKLVCTAAQQRTQFMLPNGDMLEINCPVDGNANISRLDNTMLPADLPEGFEYVSAYELRILQGNVLVPVITTSGYIRGSFVAEKTTSTYGILFWDDENKQWIPLKDFQWNASKMPVTFPFDPANPGSNRKVLSGVRYLDKQAPNRVDVSINFTGIFVLVRY